MKRTAQDEEDTKRACKEFSADFSTLPVDVVLHVLSFHEFRLAKHNFAVAFFGYFRHDNTREKHLIFSCLVLNLRYWSDHYDFAWYLRNCIPKNLQMLYIKNGLEQHEIPPNILHTFLNIRRLKIRDTTGYTASDVKILLETAVRLRDLELTYPPDIPVFRTTEELSNTLSNGFHKITRLNLLGHQVIDGELLISITSHFPNLTSLAFWIGECLISEDEFAIAAEKLQQLQMLDICGSFSFQSKFTIAMCYQS
jgi:hypothetical protein